MTFEDVKEIFKKSIDNTDTMNHAIENLIQSIYLKGYNDAVSELKSDNNSNTMKVLDKLRAEIKQLPHQHIFENLNNYSFLHVVVKIIDKYRESEEV